MTDDLIRSSGIHQGYTCIEERLCEDTAEGGHLQAKERDFRRNKLANTLILVFQPPEP